MVEIKGDIIDRGGVRGSKGERVNSEKIGLKKEKNLQDDSESPTLSKSEIIANAPDITGGLIEKHLKQGNELGRN